MAVASHRQILRRSPRNRCGCQREQSDGRLQARRNRCRDLPWLRRLDSTRLGIPARQRLLPGIQSASPGACRDGQRIVAVSTRAVRQGRRRTARAATGKRSPVLVAQNSGQGRARGTRQAATREDEIHPVWPWPKSSMIRNGAASRQLETRTACRPVSR